MINAGAKMTQLEHRIVQTRFKDGYGPVGMYFLMFKSKATNAYGEEYEKTRAHELGPWNPYASVAPMPTPLRNHLMLRDIQEGKGPIYMRTAEALQNMMEGADANKRREVESDAWEDFLDMTISQALLWASNNIDPAKTDSELVLTEPYLMGSHAGTSGAWVSGPEDAAPSEYFWGYNRMTTVNGLFAAGDGVGGSAHKFSSGSYTEGRLAAKGATNYVQDHPNHPGIDDARLEEIKKDIWSPLLRYDEFKGRTTRDDINPNYIMHKQALLRLQKIMDEYGGGWGSGYMVNGPILERGLEHIKMMWEDMEKLAARDLHELLRCWEVLDRLRCSEAHLQHLLFREETRWPGYYYRGDYPVLDDDNWKVFVTSKYSREKGTFEMEKVPFKSKFS